MNFLRDSQRVNFRLKLLFYHVGITVNSIYVIILTMHFVLMNLGNSILIILIFSFAPMRVLSQTSDSIYLKEIVGFQKELNLRFKNKKTSPFLNKERKMFNSLNFFPIDSSYKVEAKLIRTPEEKSFKMKTSSDYQPIYRKYGVLKFTINGDSLSLNVYQSYNDYSSKECRKNLFLLFTDKTNGVDTYYGGRYIDLIVPDGDVLILDFNKSYNPLCHYNSAYSCPIPPKENYLDIEVKAGIKKYK